MWGVNHRLVDWLLDLIAFDSVGRHDPPRAALDTLQQHEEPSGNANKPSSTLHEKGRMAADVNAGPDQGTGMRRIRAVVPLDFYQDDDGKGSAVVELLSLMNEAGMNEVHLEEDGDTASDNVDMEEESISGHGRIARASADIGVA
jgi:hypothetical protein